MNSEDSGRATSANRIFTSSALLIVARLSVQFTSAISTAVIARSVSVRDFGNFNAGLAVFYLATALCDWGFGLALAKRLGQGDSRDGSIVRSIASLQYFWSVFVTFLAVLYALISGWQEPRMRIAIVLAPAIAATGVSVYRQVLIANNKAQLIVVPGLVINFASAALTICLALMGFGIIAFAVVICVSAILSSMTLLYYGRQLITRRHGTARQRRRARREVGPLGLQSFLSSAYFSIDVVILGYLVSGTDLGRYTAAMKTLTLVILIPGIIAQVSIIGFSKLHRDESSTMDLQTQSWKWLSFAFLPMVVLIALYAPIFIDIYFGPDFGSIVDIVRILLLAGPIAAMSNTIFGAMIARSKQRWLVFQGLFCLVFNVVSNLVFVPRFGIKASAWISVATELFVVSGMTFALSRVGVRPVYLVRAWKFYPAILVGSLPPWFVLGSHSTLGLLISGLCILFAFICFRLIPEELLSVWRSRFQRNSAPHE